MHELLGPLFTPIIKATITLLSLFFHFHCCSAHMAQKVIMKVLTMTDEKTKQKAIEAAADVHGVDSIAADLKEQRLTVVGEMDAVALVKKLKKVGKVDILSVGPAKEPPKEEKKEEKKEEPPKEEKKEEKKEETK